MGNIRPIAFYLPQFYPTKENDEWWEPGFTEWTNVAKAKPLYRGHYQPRIPRDLGFYDLRVPETREKQAQMAREAGIEGFCYWHYWFSGKRLLDRVFREVVESGRPDFPFCLCWANHSWYKKTWNPDVPNQILMEQEYPGEEDYIQHFHAMLPAFKDKRYMTSGDGRLIFGIFEPSSFPDFELFKEIWNSLAQENGLNGFFFFGLAQGRVQLTNFKSWKYDAIVYDAEIDMSWEIDFSFFMRKWKALLYLLHRPIVINYDKYIRRALEIFKTNPTYIPCIVPDFDHSPRSGYKGHIFANSTPEKWEHLCREVKKLVESKSSQDGLLFIKAWNEWGEGNYLEPDRKYGRAYLNATRKAFTEE